MITEQVADAMLTRFDSRHPKPAVDHSIPAPLKWAASIIAALITAATIGMALWIVTTLSDLKDTVTRIDERQKLTNPAQAKRDEDQDRRLSALEAKDRGNPQ